MPGHATYRNAAAAALLAAGALLASAIPASADDKPFEWRRFNVYIGTTTGGGYDAYARMMARHIGQYLPGKPNAVPINRPGAGGLAMMNTLYATGAKDGTEVGVAAPGFAIDKVLYGEKSKAQFESPKFNWIGSMAQDPSVFIAWKSKGFTLQDLLAGKPMTVGMPGPGGSPWFYSRLLNSFFGTKLKVISGYPGIAEVLLAIETGELDGVAGTTWYGTKAIREHWFGANGPAQILVQYGKQRAPDLPDVPSIYEMTNDPQTRGILEVISSLEVIIRPVFAPPGIPAERVEIVRQAFDKAMKDPVLLEEAAKQNFPINPVSGKETQAIIERISNPPKDIAAKLLEVYGGE